MQAHLEGFGQLVQCRLALGETFDDRSSCRICQRCKCCAQPVHATCLSTDRLINRSVEYVAKTATCQPAGWWPAGRGVGRRVGLGGAGGPGGVGGPVGRRAGAQSVVRRRYSTVAKGANTARIASDHNSDAATGCCIGQAWIVAEGFGLPKRWRAAAVTALTGFQSAMAAASGHSWVGTMAFETMASRKQNDQPDALRRLGAFGDDAEAGAAPRQGVAEEREDGEAGEDRDQRRTAGRQPMASPVSGHDGTRRIAAVDRSDMDRPTSTAGRHMGRVRKRSMTPLLRSVLSPTAVPIDEVVRFRRSTRRWRSPCSCHRREGSRRSRRHR